MQSIDSEILRALYRGEHAEALRLAENSAELTVFEAAALGDANAIASRLSMEQSSLREFSMDGFTALHLAAFFGHYVCVKVLLEHGADPNSVSKDLMQVTPLHLACAITEERGADGIVAALLAAGADPNARQADGVTPLLAAQQNQHPRIEKLLRAKGAIE
jgi:uncharacterized protein